MYPRIPILLWVNKEYVYVLTLYIILVGDLLDESMFVCMCMCVCARVRVCMCVSFLDVLLLFQSL